MNIPLPIQAYEGGGYISGSITQDRYTLTVFADRICILRTISMVRLPLIKTDW